MCALLAPRTPQVPGARETEALWRPVWGALERLESLPPQSSERAALRAELQRTAARRADAARKRGDGVLAFRASVLASELFRLDGFEPSRVRDPGIEFAILPGEAHRIARAATAGRLRTRALLAAFAEPGAAEAFACEEVAAETLVEELEAMRFASAEAIGRAWLAHGAGVSDSVLCARALRASGRYEEARDLLAELRERPAPAAEAARVAVEEARLARAAGRGEDAADRLGSALVRGSAPAAVLLGRTALRERENGRALALARPILEDEPSHPEARRVWASGLLPADGGRASLAPGVPREGVLTAPDRH